MHRHLCGERVQSFHQILKGCPEPREYQVLRRSEEQAHMVLVVWNASVRCEGKEGERRGPRHNQSVQTAQLHRQRSDHQRYPIRKSKNDRPKVQRKPQFSAGDPRECLHSYLSYQDQKVRLGERWMDASPKLLRDQN